MEDANNEARTSFAFLFEWLYQEELQLAWLECLDGFLAQTKELEEAVNAAGWSVVEGKTPARNSGRKEVVLSPLPKPDRALERDTPIVWGTKAFPDDDLPAAVNWQEVHDRLAVELRRAIELRWRDYLGYGLLLDAVGEALGGDMVHPDVRGLMDAFRRKVLEMYEASQRFGRFSLPEPDAERVSDLRKSVRWEDIREQPAAGTPISNSGRGWMRPEELAELEALEARLAEELRGHREERS